MNLATVYAVKVWLTAVLLAPIIIMLSDLMPLNNFGDALFILLAGIVIGFIFSIPSAVVFCITATVLINKSLKPVAKKVILSVTGFALTYLALLIVNYNEIMGMDVIYWGLLYSWVIVAGVWFYRYDAISHAV